MIRSDQLRRNKISQLKASCFCCNIQACFYHLNRIYMLRVGGVASSQLALLSFQLVLLLFLDGPTLILFNISLFNALFDNNCLVLCSENVGHFHFWNKYRFVANLWCESRSQCYWRKYNYLVFSIAFQLNFDLADPHSCFKVVLQFFSLTPFLIYLSAYVAVIHSHVSKFSIVASPYCSLLFYSEP